MKKSLCCPKCGFNRILYIAQVADAGRDSIPRPMKLAFTGPDVSVLGMQGTTQKASVGELEAGVCRRCGYTELYVKDPGSIPVDGQHIREMVGPATSP